MNTNDRFEPKRTSEPRRLAETIEPRARGARRGPVAGLALAIGFLLAGGGCSSGPLQAIDPAEGAGTTYDVGSNVSGDLCTLIQRVAPEKIAEAGASYFSLQCGKWASPSGSVFVVEAGSDNPRGLVSDSWWKFRADQFLDCGPPKETSILDDASALALDCNLQSGGWPYQAVVTRIDDRIYLGDAIPNAYQPLEQSIGVLSGRISEEAAAEGGDASDEMRRLQGRLAGADFDVSDITQYNDVRRLARYHNERGEFAQAEQQYRKALALAMTDRPDQEAFLSIHIALELSNQQKYEASDAMFARAKEALPNSKTPTIDKARLLSYRSMHLANQRKNDEAIEAARQATKIFEESGYGSFAGATDLTAGHEFTAGSGLLLATTGKRLISGADTSTGGNAVKTRYMESALLARQGEYKSAEEALKKARRAFAGDPEAPRRWAVELDVLEADIAERQGKYGRAQGLLKSAIGTEESLLGNSRVGGRAYLALGRVHAEQGHDGAALSAFRSGFGIVAEQGGSVHMDQVLPYFQTGLKEADSNPGAREEIYAEMFEVSQLVSSAVVNQSIAQVTARLASSDSKVGGVIRELQDAERERERLRKRIDVVQGSGRRAETDDLNRRWGEVNQAIEQLELQVQVASPRYNQLLLTEPVEVDAVQATLDSDEALSLILIGAEGGVGFLVERTGLTAYPIGISRAKATAYVKTLRKPMEDPFDLPDYPVRRAHELYRFLYGPVQGHLSGKKHLITIPSGALMSLPFAMLVAERPPRVSGLDYSRVPFLIQRHALTQSPSVQSYVNLRENVSASNASRPFAGFGDAIPSGNTSALMSALNMPGSCRSEADLIAHINRLPDTAIEIRESAKVLGAGRSSVVLGHDFTEPRIRRTKLSDYRIVSFATHGLLPSKLQCLPEPALVVTPSRAGDKNGDGLLMTSEVVELEMDAELVVLSACDTGGGSSRGSGGEALSGLARSFFFAGARNLLVSHWEVPSLPTLELLVRTFEHMAEGTSSPSKALQASQQGIIATGAFSHPKAWAGFTIVGHGA